MKIVPYSFISLLFCGIYASEQEPAIANNSLVLTIIHFNDFHARFDVQNANSGVCRADQDCHGGFARLYESVMSLYNTSVNPVVLNAGDSFQGTLWYTLFRWNVTQHFMNMLPLSAHTLGNHEFDDGIEGLLPYLRQLRAPILACNVNASLVPEMQAWYRKSIILHVDGRNIAIVGVVVATTGNISNAGALTFLDEADAVNAEVERLERDENIFAAIVLSHAGYDRDKMIAKRAVRKVAMIVGGHSHTFLANNRGEDGTIPEGPYPTLIQRDVDGVQVPIVQAAAYTRYLGRLIIAFDESGALKSWTGSPIFLSPRLPQNKGILNLLQPWKDIVDATGRKVYGSTAVLLDQSKCRFMECNLGNVLADAMVFAYKDRALKSSLSIMNCGGIRASIEVGNITFNDLITAQPFANTFDMGELKGAHIKQILERAAMPFFFGTGEANVNMLQVSAGFRIVFDLSRPSGHRLVHASVLCDDCDEARYENLNPHKLYRVIVPSFLGSGGDGFVEIPNNIHNYTIGPLDMNVFERFIPAASPIDVGLEGRITFIGQVRPRIVFYN